MDQNALAIRQAQWEQIVAECNAAGISKKEWCAKNGIPEKSFYYWQRKFRKQIAEATHVNWWIRYPKLSLPLLNSR